MQRIKEINVRDSSGKFIRKISVIDTIFYRVGDEIDYDGKTLKVVRYAFVDDVQYVNVE